MRNIAGGLALCKGLKCKDVHVMAEFFLTGEGQMFIKPCCGEVAELAEGARLLSG